MWLVAENTFVDQWILVNALFCHPELVRVMLLTVMKAYDFVDKHVNTFCIKQSWLIIML